MALPNIELYEPLKKDMSEESARLIAEVVPPAGDLSTKGDIAALEAKVEQLRLSTKADIAGLEAKIEQLRLSTEADMAGLEAKIEQLRLSTEANFANYAKAIEERLSKSERRIVGLAMTLLVPGWVVIVGAGVRYVFGG